MFPKLIAQAGLLSGASGAAWFSAIVDVPEAIPNNTKEFKASSEPIPKTIENFSDIEIFERLSGCKFVFSDKSKKSKKYNSKEIVKRFKEKTPSRIGFEKAILYDANLYKKICGKGKFLNFEEKWPNKFSYSPSL